MYMQCLSSWNYREILMSSFVHFLKGEMLQCDVFEVSEIKGFSVIIIVLISIVVLILL